VKEVNQLSQQRMPLAQHLQRTFASSSSFQSRQAAALALAASRAGAHDSDDSD
jgi:hypothetical protein